MCRARSSIIAWWHTDLCDYYGTQDWKPAVIANWKLWVPFQFINFLAVPQPLQVLYTLLPLIPGGPLPFLSSHFGGLRILQDGLLFKNCC